MIAIVMMVVMAVMIVMIVMVVTLMMIVMIAVVMVEFCLTARVVVAMSGDVHGIQSCLSALQVC